MDSVSQSVSSLSTADRAAIERLLGQKLTGDQQVVIVALKEGDSADAASRAAARARLTVILDKSAANAQTAGITAAIADAAVNEAIEAVRGRTVS